MGVLSARSQFDPGCSRAVVQFATKRSEYTQGKLWFGPGLKRTAGSTGSKFKADNPGVKKKGKAGQYEGDGRQDHFWRGNIQI